jgi:hypothetical protein
LELEAKLAVHERKMAALRAEFRRRIRAARRLTQRQERQLRQAWSPDALRRRARGADLRTIVFAT